MSSLPLAGVRVLSLAEQYPGPFATMLLADLGADVILVERPGKGDPSRRFPGLFAALNRNKRSVALDLKTEDGRAQFLQLVDSADVVLEGFRPGVMARLKLDADSLRARKPSLIYTSIASFGQTGPAAAVAGHDISIQAAVGMINVPPGQEASTPLPVLPLADISSAMFAALGVVTALFARSKTGQGAALDVSMMDCLVSWMAPFLVPPANGLPTRTLPPDDPGYGLFATADGQQITLSIAGEDGMWASLCELIGLPQYAALGEVARSDRRAEIVPPLRAAIARHPMASLTAELEARRIAFGPVVPLAQVMSDPQVLARQMVLTADTSAALKGAGSPDGRMRFIRQPIAWGSSPALPTLRPVPGLGQHNEEVLGESVVPTQPAALRRA